MGPGRLTAVSDTGPLIHLAEIGCLPLLTIFEELHIPEGVWLEADRPSTIWAGSPEMLPRLASESSMP